MMLIEMIVDAVDDDGMIPSFHDRTGRHRSLSTAPLEWNRTSVRPSVVLYDSRRRR